MGADWVPVRESVKAGTLRASDPTVADVVARFDALMRYTSLQLGRRLGADVIVQLSRKERQEPAARAHALIASMVQEGLLRGALRIPNTVGDIHVTADLRANTITCHVDVDAPRTGRATTRINWLVRQLKNAAEGTRVEAFVLNQCGPGAAELLGVVREDPAVLVLDASKEFKSFRVAMTAPMGSKRGRGRGAFIDSVIDAVDVFYEEVVQHIKAWAAAPPKLRTEPDAPEGERPDLTSTALSSQDD